MQTVYPVTHCKEQLEGTLLHIHTRTGTHAQMDRQTDTCTHTDRQI